MTGKDDTAEELIDRNLGYMQLALTSVSVLDVAGDVTLDSAKRRAMWFIGFGPLFILCLLFEQTKSLFQRWLFYGIGTMFSMAVLAAMTGIAMEMVARVAASFCRLGRAVEHPPDRRHEQHGAAAGRHGVDPHDADSDCPQWSLCSSRVRWVLHGIVSDRR
ncbi:type IV secretion system protein [Stenotrophomonas indicatrix]|uniref:type IV secretion system protein n=1 Tax=Stenotrophomonas indicatrix TaxID=2045451 RepID=UPI003CCE834C